MNKTKPFFILAIITTVGVALILITARPFGASSAQANQGDKSGARIWEYCAITNAFTENSGFGLRGKAVIRYFNPGGLREEIVEFAPSIGERKFRLEEDALSIAIARLGYQKWEMVSKESGADGAFKPIYFKRPMP